MDDSDRRMAERAHSPSSPYTLLADLWLHEPDAEIIARAVSELGLPPADPAELASAYAEVFLLNVPPYGTVFTAPEGEMNGAEAQRVRTLFEAHGYCPPELSVVGAPDHVGLCLGFLNEAREVEIGELSLDWIAVCCLAVERELSAHPFYRALANQTRATLLSRSGIGGPKALSLVSNLQLPITNRPEEVSLHDLVRFFLTPARCGLFLSRSRLGRLANALGLCLPFGSRFDVAEMLFASAGETGQIERLMDALEIEIGDWRLAYCRWAEKYPAWRPFAEIWLERIGTAARTLAEMRETALTMSE